MEAEGSHEQVEAIKQALFQGRKIEAIKLYRESTGKGLADVKEEVEKLEKQLREVSPEKFTAPESKGCLGLLLGLACLGSIVVGGLVVLGLSVG